MGWMMSVLWILPTLLRSPPQIDPVASVDRKVVVWAVADIESELGVVMEFGGFACWMDCMNWANWVAWASSFACISACCAWRIAAVSAVMLDGSIERVPTDIVATADGRASSAVIAERSSWAGLIGALLEIFAAGVMVVRAFAFSDCRCLSAATSSVVGWLGREFDREAPVLGGLFAVGGGLLGGVCVTMAAYDTSAVTGVLAAGR
jgi:hypothetical protein